MRLIYHLDEVLGDVDIEKEIIQRHLRDLQRKMSYSTVLRNVNLLKTNYILSLTLSLDILKTVRPSGSPSGRVPST